ncbi:DUF5606 domain-containing protein [Dyadobacter sp. LJ53]|uniref:DUF5606 family protein n=1 Tax=Dyadobacter chenwenxiniae TaxID=2906456 RepID=UPI001F37573F|nr:DUF5606 domain-containing protein [Dyadobacter chenwenxiniae]MCF0049645.1 DUF5606 domain-containing protein [Dyadobacter chenwenxiniae]
MSEKVESTGMDLLKEIANVSGKGGLFRILKPSRAGVIVESLDEKREKTLIGPTARVSVLKDVSIFTDGEEESVPLADVFLKIHEAHGEEVTLQPKTASDKELIEFFDKILPEFDRSKVYVSDIKKIITWYNLLSKYTPELFVAAPEEAEAEEAPEVVAEEVAETPEKEKKSKK